MVLINRLSAGAPAIPPAELTDEQVLRNHQSNPTKHQEMIDRYFRYGFPGYLKKTWEDIDSLVTGVDPEGELQVLGNFNENPVAGAVNSDLVFYPHDYNVGGQVDYSIRLFQAIVADMDRAYPIEFSKAIRRAGDFPTVYQDNADIVFFYKRNGGSFYFGDLSHLYP